MGVIVACAACGQSAEHEDRWRGCLRPCPHCGGKVQVPEDPRLVEGAVRVEPVCACGMEQVDPEGGLWYRLSHVSHIDDRDSGLSPLLGCALFALGPLWLLLAYWALGPQKAAETVVRWACPACRGQVRRARAWRTLGTALVAAAFVLAPCAFLVYVLAGERRIEFRGQDLDPVVLAALLLLLCPIVGYVLVYRGVQLLLAPGLVHAHRRFWGLQALPGVKSPVLRNPDGSFTFTYRDGGP